MNYDDVCEEGGVVGDGDVRFSVVILEWNGLIRGGGTGKTSVANESFDDEVMASGDFATASGGAAERMDVGTGGNWRRA